MILSIFVNLLPNVSNVNISVKENDMESLNVQKFDWVSVLKGIPQYYQDPEKMEKKEIVSKPQTIEKKVPKRKPIEAKLVAIIYENNADSRAGVFMLPGEDQPQTLKLGEGWLDAWQLKQISADFVVWVNNEDNSELVHTLF